jgi:hypothetical protein
MLELTNTAAVQGRMGHFKAGVTGHINKTMSWQLLKGVSDIRVCPVESAAQVQ